MASKFQNRLVGTVILVSLVVIFLPDLMDGNKLEQKDEAFAKIPLRPELEPAKPALQVSAASTLPAEHLASQQQASAAEQWQVLKNKALEALEPIGSAIFGALGDGLSWVNSLLDGADFSAFAELLNTPTDAPVEP